MAQNDHVTEGQFIEYINEAANQLNNMNSKVDNIQKITAFNWKGNKDTYADLLLLTDLEVNDGYSVIADGLVYVWNGEAFPDDGDGLNLGLKPDENSKVEEGNTQAVSGGEVYSVTMPEFYNQVGFIDKQSGSLNTSFTDYKVSVFLKILDPANIVVTGYSGDTNNVALIAFYDEKFNYLGYYNASGVTGDVTNHLIPVENVPANAYYSRLTVSESLTSYLNTGLGVGFLSADTNGINSKQYEDYWNNGGYISKHNGEVVLLAASENLSFSNFLRLNKKSEKLTILSGYSGDTVNAALFAFYDAEFNFIEHYNVPSVTGIVRDVSILMSNIAPNAEYVKATGDKRSISYITGIDGTYNIKDSDVLSLIELKRKGDSYMQFYSGFINKLNGLVETTSSTFICTDYYTKDIGQEVRIKHGYSGATNNVAFVAFYNDKFEFLGYYNTPIHGENTEEITIPASDYPEGYKYLRFTFPNNVTLKYSIKGATPYILKTNDIKPIVNKNVFELKASELYNDIGYIHKQTGNVDLSSGTYLKNSVFLKILDPTNIVVTGYSGDTDNAALIAFYDAEFNFIDYYNVSGVTGNVTNHAVPTANVPTGSYYVRLTARGTQTPAFNSSLNRLIDNKYLNYYMYELQNSISSKLNNRSVLPNVRPGGQIKLINYFGNDQNIHPKVIYFNTPWNGYRYWMAYTPFFNAPGITEEDSENPCIAATNDITKWVTPTGMVNPLAEPPRTEDNPSGYNSDTHLVYREDLDHLECWWREFNPDSRQDSIVRRITTNGIDWSEKEVITAYSDFNGLSPAVVYEDGVYKMWFVYSGRVYYTESPTAQQGTWTTPTVLDILLNGVTLWHLDVEKTEHGREFLIQAYREGNGSTTSDLYHCVTTDDVTFTPLKAIIYRGDDIKDPDYRGIYRSCMIYVNEIYYVFYSAFSDNPESRKTFLTKGRDIYNLRGVNIY